MIGRNVKHYRIIEKIGAGGMGEVYRAHDQLLDRDVALKVLPLNQPDDSVAEKRLLREARMASQLNHPHICTIYEVGETEGRTYIAMEYIQGRTLSERIREHHLAVDEILQLGVQIADALAHAHERGVIHRDLKSANIVITPDGQAKVLDFGLARRIEHEHRGETETRVSWTEPGMLVGTLAYMAPEQLKGQRADARSDVWSFGVVLYEMATGGQPFQGTTLFELSSAILTQPPQPPPRHIPAELAAVIECCVEKAPARRYESGRQVLKALEAVRSGTAPMGLRTALARRRSLAVLPLQNLSGDPNQDYFVDGMHEALITDLAKISTLRVIARPSLMRLKHTQKTPREIAEELNVDAILTGSALRSGSRVRITAQLIDAASEEHLWADRYDRELRDVLSLQNEIVESVIREIQLQLTPQEQKRLAAKAKQINPEAYEAYLKGRFHWYKLSNEHHETALNYFQLALEKDPEYALAYAGIAAAWMTRSETGFAPIVDVLPKAKAAISRALELDDGLAEVHEVFANMKFTCDWDFVAAEKAFQTAIQISPNYADAHFFYSDFLMTMKRQDDAIAEFERALELDPLNSFLHCFWGWHLAFLGRYDDAIAWLSKTVKDEPSFPSARMGLWGAFYMKGEFEKAFEEAEIFFALLGDAAVESALKAGYERGGYFEAMRHAANVMTERSTRTHVPAVRIARLYAHASEIDRALMWLEEAYRRRETPLVHIGVGWDWKILHGEPRFQDLLDRIGLPIDRLN